VQWLLSSAGLSRFSDRRVVCRTWGLGSGLMEAAALQLHMWIKSVVVRKAGCLLYCTLVLEKSSVAGCCRSVSLLESPRLLESYVLVVSVAASTVVLGDCSEISVPPHLEFLCDLCVFTPLALLNCLEHTGHVFSSIPDSSLLAASLGASMSLEDLSWSLSWLVEFLRQPASSWRLEKSSVVSAAGASREGSESVRLQLAPGRESWLAYCLPS